MLAICQEYSIARGRRQLLGCEVCPVRVRDSICRRHLLCVVVTIREWVWRKYCSVVLLDTACKCTFMSWFGAKHRHQIVYPLRLTTLLQLVGGNDLIEQSLSLFTFRMTSLSQDHLKNVAAVYGVLINYLRVNYLVLHVRGRSTNNRISYHSFFQLQCSLDHWLHFGLT